MRRIVKIAAVGAIIVAGIALADRTITLLTAGAYVDSYQFKFDPIADGGTEVTAEVCGHTTIQGGGSSQPTCWPTGVVTGAIRTDAMNMRSARALPFWNGKEGL